VVLAHGRRAGPEDGQILADPRSGRLYLLMAWVRDGVATPAEPAWMMIARSDDGGAHWSRPRRFGIGNPAPQARGRVIRSSPQVPSFAIDGAGALYAVWQDSRFSNGAHDDALFTRSVDGGEHWSAARQVSVASAAGAIIPTIAAQGDEQLALLYLQLDGGRDLRARYRLAISSDRGDHFRDLVVSPTFAVVDAPELTSSPLVPGGYFLGDYMGVAPLGRTGFGALYVAATGSSGNKTDVFYVARR
jgi:hypothetical protein